jgi:hypothetical protein
MRAAGLVFGIIAISLNIALGRQCVDEYTQIRFWDGIQLPQLPTSDCWGYWQMGLVSPAPCAHQPADKVQIALSIVWNVTNLIAVCINKGDIHPGAEIALDWICFAGLFSAGVQDAILSSLEGVPLGRAIPAFEILQALTHLPIFIMACIAVHKWRRARQRPAPNQLVYVQLASQAQTPHTSLPPPPPGMAYMVPFGNGAEVQVPAMPKVSQQAAAQRAVG